MPSDEGRRSSTARSRPTPGGIAVAPDGQEGVGQARLIALGDDESLRARARSRRTRMSINGGIFCGAVGGRHRMRFATPVKPSVAAPRLKDRAKVLRERAFEPLLRIFRRRVDGPRPRLAERGVKAISCRRGGNLGRSAQSVGYSASGQQVELFRRGLRSAEIAPSIAPAGRMPSGWGSQRTYPANC